jgi:cytosine/adenosine deaminase-related metal-dependent hydrolase
MYDPAPHADGAANPEAAPTFDEFRHAVAGMLAGSCCGSGSHLTVLSGPERNDNPFKRKGYAEWSGSIKPRKPKLASISGGYLLPDVTIVGTGGARTPHQDVEVKNGRIAAIRPTGTPATEPLQTLEPCRGAFVSAAWIDMHTHLPPDNPLRLTDIFMLQWLRHGVTIVREAGDTDGTATPIALEKVLSGYLPGPEIRYAYGFVNKPPARWPNCFTYEDPRQAPAIVSRLQHFGATWVKSYEHLDVALVESLKRAAADAGLGVLGHVPVGLGIETALLPDSQHLLGVPDPKTLRGNTIVNRMVDWGSVDDARIDSLRRATQEHGLAHTPTLALAHSILKLERYEETAGDLGAEALPPLYRDVIWNPKVGIPIFRNIASDDFERLRDAIDRRARLTRLLYEDGADLRVGGDTQQPFTAPGVAIQDEIEAWEAAGIPRSAAIDRATANDARALGLADAGDVKAGYRAELLVSRRDPYESGWSAQRDILAVAARGTLVYASELDAAIARELARFKSTMARHVTNWLGKATLDRVARTFVP